ncbi:MAG: class I SAM-dependent methyltransferase [Mycobacterium sp.]
MYFGTREMFEYFVCDACETLQIRNALEGEELARHYPRKYYAYTIPPQPRIFEWLTKQRDRFDLHTGGKPVGTVVAALPPGIRSLIGSRDSSGDVVQMLGRLAIGRDARILDVGCGGGALLDRLARAGFTNLSGADPFNEADGETPLGLPIVKRYVHEVDGEFDLILFNHSLEHVPDPVATLKAVYEKLAPGGICLVRLPTTSSEAWDVYDKHWCLIDAPRHIVIPSRRGMELAANAVGLQLEEVWDDSNSSQFFGSEAYQRNIALPEIKSFVEFIRLFGLKQILGWERRSKQLNRQGRGDQAGFVLRNPAPAGSTRE